MSDTVRVKVLCGSCGKLICRVVDTPHGVVYELNITARGTVLPTTDPRTVFCAEHGMPDLHDGEIVSVDDDGRVAGVFSALELARGDGKVHVYRARVSRTWTRRD